MEAVCYVLREDFKTLTQQTKQKQFVYILMENLKMEAVFRVLREDFKILTQQTKQKQFFMSLGKISKH